MVHVTSNTSLSIDSPQGRKLFVFDRVFGPDVDQSGIWDYLSDSINAFTQGYNVSLLAYGQSGAGKSHTMGTSSPDANSNPEDMGMSSSPLSAISTPTCIFSWLRNPLSARSLYNSASLTTPFFSIRCHSPSGVRPFRASRRTERSIK